MDWVAMVFSLATVYLLGQKKKVGWIFGAAADISWMIFGFSHGYWSIVILDTVFLCLRVRGWYNWTKMEKSE